MAVPAVQQLAQVISQLPPLDQEFLYRRLERLLQPRLSPQVVVDFREKRFANGFSCPHCKSTHIHRHGKYKDRWRYRCVDCRKTFNDATASPLAGTHYGIDKWLKYAKCMSQGMSIRQSAQEVGVSVPTAFYWRHKILTALRKLPKPTLTGIVEADETFFLESQKGSRHLTRPARYSGEKAPMRGISHHQVCVLVARDRQTSTVSEVVGRGRVTAEQIETALDGVLHDCVLCTDAASAYRTYATDKEIQLEALNARRGVKKRGIYHLGNVNGYHSRLKRWIRPFNGVSTKYLPNYLVWFQRMDSTNNIPRNVVASRLLDHSHMPMVFTTTKDLGCS
ncbi:MAG: IS1595 family transposase [Thermaerobacter sp.]|nr:IS1595 family transposase [Thermaerobacter sp.]